MLPHTIAIGNIHSGTIAGKLNGVIPATTPSGWRSVYASMPAPTFSVNSLLSSCGAPHAYSTISMPRASSPAASERTLPCSREIDGDDLVGVLLEQRLEAEHHAGARERRRRCPRGERSFRGVDSATDLGGRVANGTRQPSAPVAGVKTSPKRPEVPGVRLPPIQWARVGTSAWRSAGVAVHGKAPE